MKRQHLLISIVLLTAIGGFAFSCSGCAKNDPTYTAAPPVTGNANPATVLQPGKKKLLGEMTFSSAASKGAQPKGTRHE